MCACLRVCMFSLLGYGYAYADTNSPTLKNTNQRLDININGALANTLNQYYKSKLLKDGVGWLAYNDEHPDWSTHSDYGHTKGFMTFNKTSGGFWVIHRSVSYSVCLPPFMCVCCVGTHCAAECLPVCICARSCRCVRPH